jgi:hypothetical protein
MTFVGTANTNYTNNLFFDKNAFALVTVPLVKPAGAVECSRQSKNGISVRVIPFYDGVNDKSTGASMFFTAPRRSIRALRFASPAPNGTVESFKRLDGELRLIILLLGDSHVEIA